MDASWRDGLTATHGAAATAVLARLDQWAPGLSDPKRADDDLRLFLGAVAAQADDASGGAPAAVAAALAALGRDRGVELLATLGAGSRYAFATAQRHPAEFLALIAEGLHRQVWGRRTLAAQLDAECAGRDADGRAAHLVRFKHRHHLRLILGDLAGALSLTAVVAELSDLVDVIGQAAFALARARVVARLGESRATFAVMAMGKLGARELNYSSDIDLIYVYAPGAPEQPFSPAVDPAEDHQWCQRLGAELIRLLEDPAGTGTLFRVDMRLRPEGDRGELALSWRETIDYYYGVGRPWERQAMIKARPIAGDLALGANLVAELRPWVFPQEPNWDDLEDARTMRRRIEERAQSANVKTGAGGIRDIEFLVQYLQLVHAGRMPELRSPATLPVLRLLADRGLMPRQDSDELERHYLWLRMVEHRLQMWEDRQEHELPKNPRDRAHLARRCGETGPDALADFDTRHQRVRARVRKLVGHHFLGVTAESETLLALLVEGEAVAAQARRALAPFGFRDVAKAAACLRELATEPFFLLSRNRTERKLLTVLPAMLKRIAASPDPDQTLANLVRIVSAVGGRATFYELLGDRPPVMHAFVDLAGWSNFLVELLQEVPGLPDDLCDALNRAQPKPVELFAEARALVQGLKNPAEPLAWLVARETAVTAIRDLENQIDAPNVGRRLTAVAATATEIALTRLVQERARQHGIPMDNGRATRFAVLGLGKLGGCELSYASDMDVIFVCDPGGMCTRARAGGPLDGEDFWLRVAQDLTRTFADARLYQFDARLRPDGEQGPLIANTTALRLYWAQPRDLWERLAMVRVAHLAGEPRLGAETVTMILEAALSAPLPSDAAEQVRAMRRRLEDSVAGRDHLKRGRGGYVDHEFIAQYCCLGLTPAQLPRPLATGAALLRLGELGRIPRPAANDLVRGLGRLRSIESRMRLWSGKAISSIPTDAPARYELARRCGYADIAAMDLELHLAREQARTWFDRLIV